MSKTDLYISIRCPHHFKTSYLAELAPRGIENNKPWLFSIFQSCQVLNSWSCQHHQVLGLEDVENLGIPIGMSSPIPISVEDLSLNPFKVPLMESTVLGLSVLPLPPSFPLMLPRVHGPCARLTPNGDVPLRVKGIDGHFHSPQEAPQVHSIDICKGVPLDKASDSTIHPLKYRVQLNHRDFRSCSGRLVLPLA